MAITVEQVIAQMQSLVNSANAKTGKVHKDLTSAHNELLAGYGVGEEPILQEKTVSENGEVTADSGYDGLSKVIVNVQPALQDKKFTENGTYTADTGFDGFRTVTIETPVPIVYKHIEGVGF